MTKPNETPQLGTCECHKHTNQVCDICQKVSKPLPAEPEPVSAAPSKYVAQSVREASTTVFAYIAHFDTCDLHSMRYFINDELAKRNPVAPSPTPH